MRRPSALRRLLAATLAAALCTIALAAGQAKQPPGGVSDKQRKSLAKLAEPWPDEATMAKRKASAEKRRLFQSTDPVAFTLTADFKKVTADRSTTSTAVFPAKLTVAGEDGQPITIDVNVRNRGNLRRNARTCSFPPIRIEFPKDPKDGKEDEATKAARAELKRSVFAGSENLKLATHCSNAQSYDQFVVREYLAYKAYNLITPWSLRARLAKGTYIDADGKVIATRTAAFFEEEDDLAKRVGGRKAIMPRTSFADHDMDRLTQVAIFQFMIGNTDYSIFTLHNVFLVQTPDKTLHTVPYDFDVSGIVNPPYAMPARGMNIATVLDRRYRGPCRTAEELEPILAAFRAKKDEITKLYTDEPLLTRESKEEVQPFLKDFFEIINDKTRTRRNLIDTCNKGVW